RAGEGARPVIRMGPAQFYGQRGLIYSQSALVLEGLELRVEGPFKKESLAVINAEGEAATVVIRHCRVVSSANGPAIHFRGRHLELYNTQAISAYSTGLTLVPRAEGTVRIDQCVLGGLHGLSLAIQDAKFNKASVIITSSTLLGSGWCFQTRVEDS